MKIIDRYLVREMAGPFLFGVLAFVLLFVSGNILFRLTDLVAQYGEDNARYLIEVTQQWAKNYSRGMLISFEFDGPLALREKVAAICQKRGWRFAELAGDLTLLRRWLAGRWNHKDFLEVPPLHGIFPSYDDGVIEARPGD